MSNSVRPQRRQPTRLPRPWDSPGKNTGVGCHCLLQCMKVKVKSLSRVRLFATPWTAAHQAPPSMGFSRQEYWSGLPFPSPGDVPDPGIEARSPALQADALTSEPERFPLWDTATLNCLNLGMIHIFSVHIYSKRSSPSAPLSKCSMAHHSMCPAYKPSSWELSKTQSRARLSNRVG